MNELPVVESDEPEFVELDPTGRYGRYDEVLGKGASKTVYRAFDEYEGIEVAWNQVKLHDFLQSPEDLERLYCEIHLLKTLKHNNIMKFYSSWVDTDNRNINFVTEMFTSGTLRQYRHKHKRVHNRALKHWCRQILNGLVYLHSHDPPIIHRDLKCDNIFINGNQGEVKIGDLGLAAILRNSHAARCVGTPEFMAPEVYQEEYNELVDIYAFGMCTLEMVTFEYPYSECFHPAQIYKKVISGKKPDALYKVADPEVRRFIDKCLATVSCRLPARELLKDPFLQIDDYESSLKPLDYCRDFDGIGPMLRQPSFRVNDGCDSLINGYSSYVDHEPGLGMDCILPDFESNEIDLLKNQEDELFKNVDITIKGRREDDGIFLRLRMADKEGRIRNIYFPFDLENDTAKSVVAEMVEELDISDQEVTKIADMINGEIVSLVPEWNKKLGQEESPDHTDKLDDGYCQTCGANGSKVDSLSASNPCAMNLQVLHCSSHGCAPTRGRFEEITYQLGASEQCASAGAPAISSQSDGMQQSDSGNAELGESCLGNKEKVISVDNGHSSVARESHMKDASPAPDLSEDYYENEIRQELRWLKAKYQMQLRELRDQQLGVISRNTSFSNNNYDKKNNLSSGSSSFKVGDKKNLNLCYTEKKYANQRSKNDDAAFGDYSPEHMVTAKSFYTGDLLPQYLHRATSLPVDAVDIN